MKKLISMVLALVMVFAMGATAFAATDTTISPPEHEHEWGEWEDYEDRQERYCEICGVVEIIYKDGINEENPDTGAPAALGMAVLVSAAAAASFKRR